VALASVKWLGAHGYAVLGTELLLPAGGAIQILPYFQTVDRKNGEDWGSFVARAAAETVDYLKASAGKFAREGDVYVNVIWVDQSEFQDLKPQ
jgi:hypothetical protein